MIKLIQSNQKKGIFNGAAGRPSAFHRRFNGFSLLELMIVLALATGLLTIGWLSTEDLLERIALKMGRDQVIQTLKNAQFLSLSRYQSHQVRGSGTQLWIQSKSKSQIDEKLWESLPTGFLVTANRWPSFSPYGFAQSGTISIESQHYLTQVIVGPIGSIRYTEIEEK